MSADALVQLHPLTDSPEWFYTHTNALKMAAYQESLLRPILLTDIVLTGQFIMYETGMILLCISVIVMGLCWFPIR